MRHIYPSMWSALMFTAMTIIPFLPASAEQEQTPSAKDLFRQYCQDCHGPQRDGRGPLRPLLEQDPANLTSQITQAKTDQELFSIIKKGRGEMHGWSDTFSDEQILGLVRYIRKLSP
ncbi:MAG TPA: hypothetical protein DD706_12205 [Nitrospiraceae bacterium]|nr:hypothetical protein [Nitrospiraceae bacterium]